MSTQLKIQLDNFNFDKMDENFLINNVCFRIKRKKKYYIVTSHGFLPIKNNITLNNQKLKICINCLWNEFLILKEENPLDNIKNFKDITTFDNLSTKLPSIGTSVFVNDQKHSIKDYVYGCLGFIPGYPEELYLKIEIKNPKSIKVGTPIFCNNKFQGMVSSHDNDHIYCVPSYYLIKTFQKSNVFKIPSLDKNIEKINRHIIKDNMIFNPFLGISMSVNCFLFLESERELEFFEKKTDLESVEICFKDSRELGELENKRKLINEDGFYQLTICSFHLLRRTFPKYVSQLYKEIKNKNCDLKFKIDDEKLLFS